MERDKRGRKGHDMIAYISYCECPKCKNKIPIPREHASARQMGHAKSLYCPFCREVTNMYEIPYNCAKYNMLGEKLR